MQPETREKIFALGERRLRLIESLRTKATGLSWCLQNTQIADEIASLLYAEIFDDSPLREDVAIIATGGFGRKELCPLSDIDVTLVPRDDASPDLDGLIRTLFRDLHWAYGTVLRLEVGYAYRLISDSPGLDAKTRTGLLDMRLLAGSSDLFRQLEESLEASFSAGEFVLNKIEERREMYERYNDTPLVIEPHLKEGAGGLRDFHCANWIAEAIGEQPARPSLAYDTLIRYRNLLHVASGKARDVLTRGRQVEIAEMTGVSVEAISSEVAASGSAVHKSFSRAREKLNEGRFWLSPSTLSVNGEVRVLPVSTAGEAAVGVAVATKLGLSVSDLPTRAGSDYGGPSAAYAVSTGEKTLRNLDRCSLLEQLLPELARCRTLSSRDNIHTYTVFEHTLRVVRLLDSLEPPGFLGEIRASLTDSEPLYLAALLHDVGKFDPERDHNIAGAEIARKVCERWNLAESVRETVVWLVEEHLSMERFIRIRDLMHPGTIEEFARLVRDPERLKLLTLLTWADVNAVAPGTWNQAQDVFLRQLYEGAARTLEGDSPSASDGSQSRQRLLRQFKKDPQDEQLVQAFLESLPVYYLASTSADVVRLQMQLAQAAAQGRPTVEEFARSDLAATEITVCSLDSPGLLSRMLGVLYAFDLSVIGIRACTTSSPPPVAIDVFTVSFGGRIVPKATMGQVSGAFLDVLTGKKTIDDLLTAKGKDPWMRQQIFTYNYIAGNPGILEIRAPRGRGMAFRFSRLFAAHGWNIVAARVGQWAGNGAAAFYLTDASGEPLYEEEVRDVLAEELADRQEHEPASMNG
jgi:[protein-PII] uridylyltransferase